MSTATDAKRARAGAALESSRAATGDVPAVAGQLGSLELPDPKRARKQLPRLDVVPGGALESSRAARGDLPAVAGPGGALEPPDAKRAATFAQQ